MIQNQGLIFLAFTFNGVIIGFIFDLFRVHRKTFKISDIITYIEDFIYWIITGIITVYFMFRFSDGELRAYTFIGIIIGAILYFLTISQYIMKVFIFIIEKIKIIFSKIFRIFIFLFKNLQKFTKKIKIFCKNRGFLG